MAGKNDQPQPPASTPASDPILSGLDGLHAHITSNREVHADRMSKRDVPSGRLAAKCDSDLTTLKRLRERYVAKFWTPAPLAA